MKTKILLFLLVFVFCLSSVTYAIPKKKILIVSSYHREYLWSQETNEGLCAGFLNFGYFDNKEQISKFTSDDIIETSAAIIKKLWMDTKRNKTKDEQARITVEFTNMAKEFQPDLIMLGDDNAAQYIGAQFLDSRIPIVFWGVNNTPVKYGLVDSLEKPGHNVTGIYQTGYYKEGLEFLKKIKPQAKKFAILADNTSSGRSHLKKIEYFAHRGELPLELVETVDVGDFEIWKKKALDLQNKVDAFFLAQYTGLKDGSGNHVSAGEVTQWYLANIKIPEVAVQGQFVKQGMLCAADDGGYNQGYEAVVMAHDILAKGADPAMFPPRTPKRGALMINKQRAKALGITLTDKMGIEEFIE
ncbi:MAG: hypothetical protein KKE17_15320 [Proteobacteria bacterium]|nr:hypothetical protein [Pseudomonadota bacterium]MBU1711370.1 hypothetical protein [Pseudomonadota bacterium]